MTDTTTRELERQASLGDQEAVDRLARIKDRQAGCEQCESHEDVREEDGHRLCLGCREEIEAYWQERWDDHNADIRAGLYS